ncbi:hypothetical protein, conserved [Eimeria tenella]|uniref:Uncharacterized protein n=1 Tax=Eimeria tenella TaxID=5802 RepID=U6L3L4_EIMTE|nr:hypothetical protein, conserved [Eimeria tenella]CDJ43798.1 hypothetical protein, conserved [Eimeria tenella]|eukprot:XP_013234547.1 hypothetical protein, conserved [Eimeria tenella]
MTGGPPETAEGGTELGGPCVSLLSLSKPLLPASLQQALSRRCSPAAAAAAAAADPPAAAAAAAADCFQCRLLGCCLLSGASFAALSQAALRAPRSSDRYFYSFVAASFAGLAVYRFIVPTKGASLQQQQQQQQEQQQQREQLQWQK